MNASLPESVHTNSQSGPVLPTARPFGHTNKSFGHVTVPVSGHSSNSQKGATLPTPEPSGQSFASSVHAMLSILFQPSDSIFPALDESTSTAKVSPVGQTPHAWH